jgi:acyl-CoA synthetase (AMP-forming)/AMP-acid ligase II
MRSVTCITDPPATRSLVSVLREAARESPDARVLTLLDSRGEPAQTLSAGELDRAARSLAAELLGAAQTGDRVIVPAMPGLRFHVAFMACLYARLVAVPVPPVAVTRPAGPGRSTSRRVARLQAICRDAQPSAVVVADETAADVAAAWAGTEILGQLRVVPATVAGGAQPLPEPEPPRPGDLAFLQYTSGSTGSPRGVMITHEALLRNQAILAERSRVSPRSTLVSWLPLYHDMGLCLGLLAPVYTAAAAVVMEPETFLIQPIRWLEAISAFDDVMTAAPDFGYSWCARQIPAQAKGSLNLAGLRMAISGAEPVRAETLHAFYAAFKECGLQQSAMTPCYGLAESTLFVSGGSGLSNPIIERYDRAALGRGRAVRVDKGAPGGSDLVGCGEPGAGIQVAIVDPDTRTRLPQGDVGEIWVRSPSNGSGYWGHQQESRETFGAQLADEPDGADGSWLRTGDLGFTDGGELFVTGRRKEIIVIRGANYYPHDFERLAGDAHPVLADGLAAAFDGDAPDRVIIVTETTSPGDAGQAAVAAVQAVTAELPVTTDVVVVPRGQVPRTTSGKVRRHECAQRLRQGQLSVLAQWPRDTYLTRDASPEETNP